MPNQILYRSAGFNDVGERPALAAEAIQPGMLVEPTANGALQKHATSEGPAQPWFALEVGIRPLGITTTSSIDRLFVDGERVPHIKNDGKGIYALLINGANGNAADGATLSSNGDGTLRTSAINVVARADEVKDNSGGGAPVRIKVST